LPEIYYKYIDLGTITAGSTVSNSWSADDDYKIKRIFVVETTGTKVGVRFLTATLRIDSYVFTKDKVNLDLFEGKSNQVPVLDFPFTKGKTFYYSVTNNHGTDSISAVMILELWKE